MVCKTGRPTINSASCSGEVFCVSRWATISPLRITDTLSVTAIISFNLWVMSKIVTPCARRDRNISNSCWVSCGVRTPVGSSKISTRAPRYNAFKISTRCCKPTGRSCTSACKSTCRPYFSAIFCNSLVAFSKPVCRLPPPS